MFSLLRNALRDVPRFFPPCILHHFPHILLPPPSWKVLCDTDCSLFFGQKRKKLIINLVNSRPHNFVSNNKWKRAMQSDLARGKKQWEQITTTLWSHPSFFHAARYDKRPVTRKRLLSYESSDHVFLLARIGIVNDVRSALESNCSIPSCTKSFYFHCIIFFDCEESQGACLACTSLYTSVSSSSILCSKLFFSISSLKMFHTSV